MVCNLPIVRTGRPQPVGSSRPPLAAAAEGERTHSPAHRATVARGFRPRGLASGGAPWIRLAALNVTLAAGLLAAGSLAAAETLAATPPAKDKFHLYLLVGQSNMAGRGAIEAQDQEVHPRVWSFGRDRKWKPAVAPLHFDKPVAGVGLGRSFGIEAARRDPSITVGLIPCAVGGSPIDSWQPGGFHRQTNSHPYDDALARARAALRDGTLKGILWHQGESDAKPELAPHYAKKLDALIARLRRELKSPEVPFIGGQLGKFLERPWDDSRRQVDQAQRDLPRRVAHTAYVSSEGLTSKSDLVHFDSTSLRELGRRYFAAYQKLAGAPAAPAKLPVELRVAHEGFDGNMCWVHARAGVLPAGAAGERPLAVMTMQKLLLSGSDVFYALNETRSSDGGNSWTAPAAHDSFARQRQADGREVTVCDFTPAWHAATGKLLGTGHTVWYENNRVMHVRPRATAYAVYDPKAHRWSDWQRLALPQEAKFENAGAGSVQRYDLAEGTVLLPIYHKVPAEKQYSTTVLKCRFDGEQLTYVSHGNSLTVPVKRGLYEPSVTWFRGRYYLTMRNDDAGYVAVSDDGLQYSEPRPWSFDDGEPLGNYNTQQHWVRHPHGLYLVYTRRGADNDHVFRHRAPLFLAEVDPHTLRVIRETEQILVPEKGARLGNFGVTQVSPRETWVTVTEWMQPQGVEKYGSDNRVYVAVIRW